MILRFFRAEVHPGSQEEFRRFFLDKALPNIRRQKGLVSVMVGLPRPEAPCEFSMCMVWRDVEAIKGFAGENWNKAVIDPDEVHLLSQTHLYHYDLAAETPA